MSPKAAEKTAEVVSPTGVVFTLEMIQQLVATAVATAIQEAKRLSPEDQEAYDEKKKRERAAKVNRVKEAVMDERVRRETQFACSHIKQAEGVHERAHAFRGQVSNDNCCRPVCVRCFKLFPKFKVTDEQLKTGMNLGAVKNLTADILYSAHMKSFPDCPECLKGGCAAKDLRELRAGRLDPVPEVLPTGKLAAASLTA